MLSVRSGVAALLSMSAFVQAGVVDPGETVVIGSQDFQTPEGRVLAKSVLPFSLEYAAGPTSHFVDFAGSVDGTLTTSVVRDEKKGTLLFVYDVDLDPDSEADASDASIFSVNGFEAFKTDVSGVLDREKTILASRTRDGSAVKLTSDDAGLGGAPRLIVRTDAIDFAPTGTARFFAGDELAVKTPDGPEMQFAAGTAIVAGTFQPVFTEMPAPAPAPTPIPLPPAAGLGAVGLAIAAVARRRVQCR